MSKIALDFYRREDVILIARELIGKSIFSNIDGYVCGGMIVETEAYRGPEDRGSHAFEDRLTPRNSMMYEAGGKVYMYICYGIHNMLNIVTGKAGSSHAILIRAVEPQLGLDIMRIRRGLYDNDQRLCKGPGALAQALGLHKGLNGADITGQEIWVEDRGIQISRGNIIEAPRVGMNFDGPYKTIPWRFYLRDNKFVSRPIKKATHDDI